MIYYYIKVFLNLIFDFLQMRMMIFCFNGYRINWTRRSRAVRFLRIIFFCFIVLGIALRWDLMLRSSRCTDCQVSRVKFDWINLDIENFFRKFIFFFQYVQLSVNICFCFEIFLYGFYVQCFFIFYMLMCVKYVFVYVIVLRYLCRWFLYYLYVFVDGFYVQCFVRVFSGEKVFIMEETSEGYGKEEKFVILKYDYESFQLVFKFFDDLKVRGCFFFFLQNFYVNVFNILMFEMQYFMRFLMKVIQVQCLVLVLIFQFIIFY